MSAVKTNFMYANSVPIYSNQCHKRFEQKFLSFFFSLTGRDDRSPYALHKMLGLYGRKEDYSDVKQTLSFTETDPKGPTEEDPSTLQRLLRATVSYC